MQFCRIKGHIETRPDGPPASLQLGSAVGLEMTSSSLKTESSSTDFVHLNSDFTPRCVCIDCQANLVVFSWPTFLNLHSKFDVIMLKWYKYVCSAFHLQHCAIGLF